MGYGRAAANGPLSSLVVASHGESREFIAHEALQRGVGLVRTSNAAEAAQHLRAMAD